MSNYIECLTKLANFCDKKGHYNIADELDNLLVNGSFIKVGQYVGVIGYINRMTRAIQNCQRRKGAADSRPQQVIVMECLKEYNDSQDFYDDKWIGKYASHNTAKNQMVYVNEFFKQACINNLDLDFAKDCLINHIYRGNNLSADISNLERVETLIKEAGLNGKEDFNYFFTLCKEAKFWDTMKNVGRGISNFVGFNWSEILEPIKNLRAHLQQLNTTYTQIITSASQFANNPALNQKSRTHLQQAIQSSDYNAIQLAMNNLVRNLNQKPTAPAAADALVAPTETPAVTPSPPLGPGEKVSPGGIILTARNKYRHVYAIGGTGGAGDVPVATPASANVGMQEQAQKLLTKLQSVPAIINNMSKWMANISQITRAGKLGGQEMTILSQNINQLSQKPFDQALISAVTQSINNFEQKMRNPQQEQQTAEPAAAGEVEPTADPAGGVIPFAGAPAAGGVEPAVVATGNAMKAVSGLDSKRRKWLTSRLQQIVDDDTFKTILPPETMKLLNDILSQAHADTTAAIKAGPDPYTFVPK